MSIDDVYPCANPNINDSFGYQCVEFSNRFESVVYGEATVSGPGASVVSELHSQDGVPVSSTSNVSPPPGALPVPGDVISMSGAGQDSAGHTGVVASVTATGGTGNYTIVYYDENGDLSGGESVGKDTITVSDWVWQPAFPNGPYRYNDYSWTEQGGGTLSQYDSTFQANTGALIRYGPGGNVNTGQGVHAGTSPSIAALAGGGYEMAFQAKTGTSAGGNLIVYGDGGKVNTGQGMAAGTSPSIAASPSGGFEVAFQADTGHLYTYSSKSGPAATDQGMKAGTSPSIAP